MVTCSQENAVLSPVATHFRREVLLHGPKPGEKKVNFGNRTASEMLHLVMSRVWGILCRCKRDTLFGQVTLNRYTKRDICNRISSLFCHRLVYVL
jgi:hypothetical protein